MRFNSIAKKNIKSFRRDRHENVKGNFKRH